MSPERLMAVLACIICLSIGVAFYKDNVVGENNVHVYSGDSVLLLRKAIHKANKQCDEVEIATLYKGKIEVACDNGPYTKYYAINKTKDGFVVFEE